MKQLILLVIALAYLQTAQSEPKRALVTGGAGFLGSHMCDKLIEEGYEVVCLDNLQTGSLENISHLLGHPLFTFLAHDLVNPIDLEVEEIYNFACPASPVHYQADAIKTFKTSVLGALHLLELAKRYNAKIFQSSTSEVYGDPHVHPQTESYWGHVNPIGIRSCYDEGKRAAETLFFDYQRTYGINIKVARIFNTYGPRMSREDGRVVSNFIVQALAGQPITIYGTGEQTRSFCYVSDLIEGIWQLMQTPDDFTGPVNLGNDGEFTMLELARKVVELTGSSSEIAFQPLPQDDPTQRRPDLSLANQALKWSPKISLNEGLKLTIKYFDVP